MKQPGDNPHPWWKKLRAIWFPETLAESKASSTGSDLPESVTGDELSQTISVESNKQLPRPEQTTESAPTKPDAGVPDPPKQRLTHYERFQRRMARREQGKIVIKRLTKKERDKKKRAADKKRLQLVREHREALRLKKMQCRNTWGRLESGEWMIVCGVLRSEE